MYVFIKIIFKDLEKLNDENLNSIEKIVTKKRINGFGELKIVHGEEGIYNETSIRSNICFRVDYDTKQQLELLLTDIYKDLDNLDLECELIYPYYPNFTIFFDNVLGIDKESENKLKSILTMSRNKGYAKIMGEGYYFDDKKGHRFDYLDELSFSLIVDNVENCSLLLNEILEEIKEKVKHDFRVIFY